MLDESDQQEPGHSSEGPGGKEEGVRGLRFPSGLRKEGDDRSDGPSEESKAKHKERIKCKICRIAYLHFNI